MKDKFTDEEAWMIGPLFTMASKRFSKYEAPGEPNRRKELETRKKLKAKRKKRK